MDRPDTPGTAQSDFRLYHSNSLEVLAGLMAETLRDPAPGQSLLAPDMVLIPQAAMRRWLQATLAQAHGISANIEFLTPGEFVQRALDANVEGTADDLDAAALHWRLYAALRDPGVMRDPALRPLQAYLADDDALKPWSLAGELAGVFEKYQAWRRDWLLGWEAGAAPRDPQAALWRKIAGGSRHRARRIDDYLARFAADDAPLPAGLPSRVFAFATINASPDVLRVIATQARVGTLHFYLPTPTRSYWGDLATLGERLRAAPPGQDAMSAHGGDENPLLQAWGAAGRDFMAVLGGYEVVHPSGDIAAYDDPETRSDDDPVANTLLQQLQRDLLHRRPPPDQSWRASVDRSDNSLQFHACHTRLREVQVLHDQLRGLLEDPRFDPPLQPREIAVLAPDVGPYAPHIQAVFGGLSGSREYLPYTLADNSPLGDEPLADVFVRLLALPVSRFGLDEILDLLATPAIATAAGLDTPALDRLRGWLHAAGARWGLDANHRQRNHAPRDDAYTWAFALDRLLLGHASGSEEDIAGVAPWTQLEGGGLDALDTLIRLLRVLARHERTLGETATPAQWRERLLGLLDALFVQAPRDVSDQRAIERLRTSIGAFADDAARAGFDAPVPPEVVRTHFATQLAQADTRAPLLTGGVSFGRMVPMRLLPFRVICVLGMNDGDYPRRDPAAGLNQLTAELGTDRRRRGDRSLRDDDRFLLLQLFAAAGDVFYLSYLGADARDGSVREPSPLVSELLEVAADYHANPKAARRQLVVSQPLQPFAPAAFGAASDDADERPAADSAPGAPASTEPRRFSYRGQWHPAAEGALVPRIEPGRWLVDPLPPAPAVKEVSVVELRRFLRDPPAAFLRQRLALRLPDGVDASDDRDPLVLPPRGLQRWQLQEAVLDACVEACASHDAELRSALYSGLHAHLRARALLPSGPLGKRQLETMLHQVRPYADRFVQWRGDDTAVSVPIDIALDGVRLTGRVERVHGRGLARIRQDKLHGPAQIDHGLDWLLLGAQGEGRELVQFHDTTHGPATTRRDAVEPEAARTALHALLRLRNQGLTEPLPFGPRAGWALYEAADEDKGWAAAARLWHVDRGYSEGDTDSARLALRGRDPFADPERGDDFREIAHIIFDAVTLGRDHEAMS